MTVYGKTYHASVKRIVDPGSPWMGICGSHVVMLGSDASERMNKLPTCRACSRMQAAEKGEGAG